MNDLGKKIWVFPDAFLPLEGEAYKTSNSGNQYSHESLCIGIGEDGRVMNLDPSNTALIGSSNIKWMKNSMGDEGEFAILSATSQATNQNAWIEEMKKEFAKPEYSKMKWVDTVYGDDLFDKSYQEALGLFKKYPNLKGIISPTSVGIVAAAKAVEDQGLVGKVYVVGTLLPNTFIPQSIS